MVAVNGVCIGIRAASSALEIFATDKTPIRVDIGQGDGADFLKVKVELCSVDLWDAVRPCRRAL